METLRLLNISSNILSGCFFLVHPEGGCGKPDQCGDEHPEFGSIDCQTATQIEYGGQDSQY